ncbi:MAG TPA: indolepyruvate oxidoreductase subunit beta family protein [Alphaproteobacteria bacterium]|nr:indolepyruvate oxidoreductase subunit beta family protein [Alphaproteobacteria bacterium]
MNEIHVATRERGRVGLNPTRPLTIAILALGGQGGGVLMDWIVALAERAGWIVQATSVPGVAQRTGATVYYVEMVPMPAGGLGTRRPVLSLMPAPGDVDVVIGAELMEAGRAILRGYVTPDRTTLIVSTHRAYAVQEKMVPGDGIGDPAAVGRAAREAAKRVFAFDMAALATRAGSVISAVMFGALAGSGATQFERASFEETIRATGVGVEASLRAFALGFEAARAERSGRDQTFETPDPAAERRAAATLAPVGHPSFDALVARAAERFPASVHDMLAAGLRRVVDFQDIAYGAEYLDTLEPMLALDRMQAPGADALALTREAAKYVAVAMAYDDVIRVADLKTRASRFARVRRDVGAAPDQVLHLTEFMHPRMEEVCGTLPALLGRFIEARPRLMRALDRSVNRGRRVRTGTLGWFLILYSLGGLKRWRRGTLRHARERAHWKRWLDTVMATAPRDYALAVELLRCRRLVKGYSDTAARGQGKFERVLTTSLRLVGRPDAAEWSRRLREAALRDEEGVALDGAIRTVESFLG